MPSSALKSCSGNCGAALTGAALKRLPTNPSSPPALAGAARSAPSKANPKAVFTACGLLGTGPAKWQGMTDVKSQSETISSTHLRVCTKPGS